MHRLSFADYIFEYESFGFEMRQITVKDAAAFHDFIMRNRAGFGKYFPVTVEEVEKGKEATRRYLAAKAEDQKEGRVLMVVGILRSTGEIIYSNSAFGFDWRLPKCELAWMLDPDWQGMGLAKHFLGHFVQALLNENRMYKLICRIEPGNTRSLQLAEKMGFRTEGMHRNDFRDGTGALVDVNYMALWNENGLNP